MQIHNVGYKFKHRIGFEVDRPNGSGDYMLLVLRTKAEFLLEGKEIVSVPESVILYNKGTPQKYKVIGDTFVNDWIHFDMTSEEVVRLSELQIPFDTLIPLDNVKDLSQIIKTMYQEKYSINPHRERTLELYFELLCIKMSEKIICAGEVQSSPNYAKLSSLRADIYNHPEKSRTINELAKETMLSDSYFQHLYKRFFGVSVVSDVILSRVEHGKFLLSASQMSVSSVAYECGYKNDVQFMRQFKTVTGMTPSEYRKLFRISSEEIVSGHNKQPYNL